MNATGFERFSIEPIIVCSAWSCAERRVFRVSSQDDCRPMIVLDRGQSWMNVGRSCTNVSLGFLAELAAAL
jgi:hypothetical protein